MANSIDREIRKMTFKHIATVERKLDDWFYDRAFKMGMADDGDGSSSAALQIEKEVSTAYGDTKHELTMCMAKPEMPSEAIIKKIADLTKS